MTMTFKQSKLELERAVLACAFRGEYWAGQVISLCSDWKWESGFHLWIYESIRADFDSTREVPTPETLTSRVWTSEDVELRPGWSDMSSAFIDDIASLSSSPNLTLKAMSKIARTDTLRRTSSAVLDAIDEGKSLAEISAVFEEGKVAAIGALAGEDDMIDWLETAEARIKGYRENSKDITRQRFQVPLEIIAGATRGGMPAAGRVMMIMGDTNAGKCLSGDTLVAMADGSRRRIDSLSGGGDVLAFDGEKFVIKTAEWIDNGIKEVFEVVTSSGRTIKATANHPFLTSDGWVPLEDLVTRMFDNMMLSTPLPDPPWTGTKKTTSVVGVDNANGAFEDPILYVRHVGPEHVYDLCVPDLHNFVANELVVHNSSLAAAFGFHAAVTSAFDAVVLHIVTEELKEDLHARYDAQVLRYDRGELIDGGFDEKQEAQFIKRFNALDCGVVKHLVLPMGASVHEVRPRLQQLRARYPGRPIFCIIDSPDYLNSGRKNLELRHDISAVYQTMKSWTIDKLLAPLSLCITTQVSGVWEGKLPPISGASESRDKGRIVDLGIAIRELGEVRGRDGWKSFELGINKNRIGKMKNCLIEMSGDLGTCTYEATSPVRYLSDIEEEKKAAERREALRKR
jgi:hypothetical protein